MEDGRSGALGALVRQHVEMTKKEGDVFVTILHQQMVELVAKDRNMIIVHVHFQHVQVKVFVISSAFYAEIYNN